MKPGYRTTEFWLALVAAGVGLLAAFGLITTEQRSAITEAAGVVATALVAAGYAHSRGAAKRGGK